MNWKVTKAYTRSRENPVSAKAGDLLETGKRDDYDGNVNIWIWCKDKAGREGWVAEHVLEPHGSNARLKQDFNALELSLKEGEMLEGLAELACWLLAKNSKSETGWVPLDHLEKLA